MIYRNDITEKNAAMQVAELMCAAARTAPKARGTDTLEIMILDGEDKDRLTVHMRDIGERTERAFFIRDAGNLDRCHVVVLIGSSPAPRGLNCSLCGVPGESSCEAAASFIPPISCAIDISDLGIAVGSAAATAIDHRMDNRVMFSAGVAALELELFSDKIRICYGIGLSVSGKNVFFDRPPV